jgi:hypothetical protein
MESCSNVLSYFWLLLQLYYSQRLRTIAVAHDGGCKDSDSVHLNDSAKKECMLGHHDQKRYRIGLMGISSYSA